MAKKTISQALKDLFLGLGGNESALADNTSASDYIQDLESAIKSSASSVIDDEEASDTTTYSSNKIASLIPEAKDPEYLKVHLSNMTAEYAPTITFPNSYSRERFVGAISHNTPSILALDQFAFDNMTKWIGGYLLPSISIYSSYVIYSGIVEVSVGGGERKNYELFFKIGKNASDDAFYYKEFEFPTT